MVAVGLIEESGGMISLSPPKPPDFHPPLPPAWLILVMLQTMVGKSINLGCCLGFLNTSHAIYLRIMSLHPILKSVKILRVDIGRTLVLVGFLARRWVIF